MNATVSNALNTLESTLATLLDSVASYNPSPQAAAALVQADEQLTESLETLEQHQSSHHRILELRSITATLDDQLTELLVSLSETRQELLKCPGTRFDNNPRDIPYTDLLSYASKISKFSQPANPAAFKKLVLEARSAAAAQQSQAVDGTNAAGSNTNNDTTKAADGSKPPLGLTAEEALAADPFSGQQFAPWPSEQEMKSGALVTLKNGQIPWDMLGEEERKKAEKEKEKEERRARGEYVPDDEDEDGAKKDGDDQDKKNLMAAGGQQRAPGAGPGEVKKPKVNLSLDLYDPDEE